jgi:integrase
MAQALIPIQTADSADQPGALDPRQAARPAAAYLASLRTATGRVGMASALNTVARMALRIDPEQQTPRDWMRMDWRTLNAANVQAIASNLTGAPATINKTLAALRGTARAAWQLGEMDTDNYQRIKDVRGARGSRLPTGRDAADWELAALMRVCANDATPSGARDACAIAIGAKTGARRAELVSIRLDAITRTDEADGVRGVEIAIIGKGDKERRLFIEGGALLALRDWLEIRGDAGTTLLCPINKGGRIDTSRGMSTTALHKALLKRCRAAGVNALHWHDFRRTVAGILLDKGEDISTVASVLGHAQVTTTARYDRRPEEAKRRAVRKISVPYFPRATR